MGRKLALNKSILEREALSTEGAGAGNGLACTGPLNPLTTARPTFKVAASNVADDGGRLSTADRYCGGHPDPAALRLGCAHRAVDPSSSHSTQRAAAFPCRKADVQRLPSARARRSQSVQWTCRVCTRAERRSMPDEEETRKQRQHGSPAHSKAAAEGHTALKPGARHICVVVFFIAVVAVATAVFVPVWIRARLRVGRCAGGVAMSQRRRLCLDLVLPPSMAMPCLARRVRSSARTLGTQGPPDASTSTLAAGRRWPGAFGRKRLPARLGGLESTALVAALGRRNAKQIRVTYLRMVRRTSRSPLTSLRSLEPLPRKQASASLRPVAD